jgi:hypothetical protein
METEALLRSAVFTNQSPAAADYFQERLPSCFTTDIKQSHITIQVEKQQSEAGAIECLSPDGFASQTGSPVTETTERMENGSTVIRSSEELRTLLQVQAVTAL